MFNVSRVQSTESYRMNPFGANVLGTLFLFNSFKFHQVAIESNEQIENWEMN